MRIAVATEVRAQFGLVPEVEVFVYERGTTTEVPVHQDRTGATTLAQPLTTSVIGTCPGFIEHGGGLDLVVDGETVEWQAVPGSPFKGGGLLVGVPDDYVPSLPDDIVFADTFGWGAEPGAKAEGPGGSALVGRVGTQHGDRASQRTTNQTMVRVVAIGDNAQFRLGRPPGWGHAYPIGSEGAIRRRPVGHSVFVGTPATPDATSLYIFPAKSFPGYFDDTEPGVELLADGQSITYTAKVSRNAWLSGDAALLATEIAIAEAQDEGLPSEGYFRVRGLQVHYSGREQILDGNADGIHKAGATTLVVKNVSDAEWAAIPQTEGALRVIRVTGGGRRFKYVAASYDSGTDKVTFTLDDTSRLDKSVADNAAVTMRKLTGLECDFVHFTEGDRAIGEDELTMSLIGPYSGDPVDPALVATIPFNGGFLRVETYDDDPPGPGKKDFPTQRLEYTAFDPETKTITLAAPLTAPVPHGSLIEIEGCPGMLRARNSGMDLAMHRLDGVEGLAAGAETGAVVQFNPRYGNPNNSGSKGHLALDHWKNQSGFEGYASNIAFALLEEGMGSKNPGARTTFMVRVPGSGYRLQKFTIAPMGLAVLGAGVRGHGDVLHNLHVGEWYTRVKPPNIVLDCECDPDDPDCDCEEEASEGGTVLSATLNVATVIGGNSITLPSRFKVTVHNRETGTESERVFNFTGLTETPNPAITGVTWDQAAQGPKTTLSAPHTVGGATIAVVSAGSFVTPVSGFKAKLRAVDGGGNVVATWTYTGKAGNTFTGVEVVSGSGTLPAGTRIEENYSLGDFWVDSGREISLADDVRHAAFGSATNSKTGTDRPAEKQTESGVVGPEGQAGHAMGPDTSVYRKAADLLRTDDALEVGDDLTVEEALAVGDDATIGGNATVGGDVAVGGKIAATGGVAVGNNEAASSLGNVIGKTEVFDAEGNSLGYVPIFDEIGNDPVGVPIDDIVVRIEEFDGLRWLEPFPNTDVYLLEPGDRDRANTVDGSDPDAVAAFLAGETEIQVYEDRNMTATVDQPLTTDGEGRYEGFIAVRQFDTYVPADEVRPIQTHDAATGRGALT